MAYSPADTTALVCRPADTTARRAGRRIRRRRRAGRWIGRRRRGTAGARRRQRVRRRVARCRRRERPHIRRRCAGDHARRHPVAPREHALQVDAVVAALDVGGGKPGDIAPGRAAEQQSGAGADRGPRSGLTGRRADDGAGGGAERGAGDGIGRDGVVVGLASGDSAKRGIRVLPAGRRVGLELRRRLRRPRQRRDAGPAGYLCAGGDEGACGERQQDRAQAHWTTFVLRTSVFALGAAHRAHAFALNSSARRAQPATDSTGSAPPAAACPRRTAPAGSPGSTRCCIPGHAGSNRTGCCSNTSSWVARRGAGRGRCRPRAPLRPCRSGPAGRRRFDPAPGIGNDLARPDVAADRDGGPGSGDGRRPTPCAGPTQRHAHAGTPPARVPAPPSAVPAPPAIVPAPPPGLPATQAPLPQPGRPQPGAPQPGRPQPGAPQTGLPPPGPTQRPPFQEPPVPGWRQPELPCQPVLPPRLELPLQLAPLPRPGVMPAPAPWLNPPPRPALGPPPPPPPPPRPCAQPSPPASASAVTAVNAIASFFICVPRCREPAPEPADPAGTPISPERAEGPKR